LKKHSDNNRWTDNKIANGGTDIKLVTPNTGISNQLMLVSGNQDDRIIQTQPVEMTAQYNFITAEAMVARITSKTDPAYSKRCLDAAKKCFDWCLKSGKDTTSGVIGRSTSGFHRNVPNHPPAGISSTGNGTRPAAKKIAGS
jgi:hypothetical protein